MPQRKGLNSYMVLRTVYMSPEMDIKLRRRARAQRKSKNEVIREILNRGLERQETSEGGELVRPQP